jgi:hypothetical protein
MPKTYTIKANRTAADVISGNDITLESGLTIEEAQAASLEYQRQGNHICVWIEEEEAKKAPRVVRSIERDFRGNRYEIVRCDGWQI